MARPAKKGRKRGSSATLHAIPARELLDHLAIGAPTAGEVDAQASPVVRGWIYGHLSDHFSDNDTMPDSLRKNIQGVEAMLDDVAAALARDPALHFDNSRFTISGASLANQTKNKSIGFYIGRVCYYARLACGLSR